jgi:NADP-dependent 3-hydroxy acid dehydrogenase YdfG
MRAVVMGGTSGIGLAVADALTSSGIEVTVTGRDAAKLAALDGRVAAVERLDSTDRARNERWRARPAGRAIRLLPPGTD